MIMEVMAHKETNNCVYILILWTTSTSISVKTNQDNSGYFFTIEKINILKVCIFTNEM